MNKEEIIRMAREAGMPEWLQEDWFADPFDSFALKFATLVAAAEREACAALCDKISDDDGFEGGYADNCAIAIRARSQ